MTLPMRQPQQEDYLQLPDYLNLQSNLEAEISFYAKAWKKAKTTKQKNRVVKGLMVNAGKWDEITRSLNYYPEFERLTGESFPGFWR